MGVYSDGSYNVPAGLIYSFPVTCSGGEWKIVQGMIINLTDVTLKLVR
jgi:malate dehydrogenase